MSAEMTPDEEKNERCDVCGVELSQCGEPNPDGEPTLDCKLCLVRENLGDVLGEKVKLEAHLSTLAARLKEAERLLAESKEEIGHYECCPQEFGDEEQPCTCGNINIVERIESFLAASTPVEKEK